MNEKPHIFGSATKTLVASGNQTVADIVVEGHEYLTIDVAVATQNLDAFIVNGKAHPDGTFRQLTNAITATPGGIVIAASTTFASIAAAGGGTAVLLVKGLHSVQIQASAASDGAVLTLKYGVK